MLLWFHVFRRVSVSDQTFKHPSPNPPEKGGNAKIPNRHQSTLRCCRSCRQIRQTLSSRSGFLTDYTINKGYGYMTAYHEKGVKGGKHGPVYLSSRCWRPEESAWLWVDTNGTTQRRDKALRHFLLIKFNKPHLRHTGIQRGAFREKGKHIHFVSSRRDPGKNLNLKPAADTHSERVRVTIRYTMNNRINRYIFSLMPLSPPL